MGKKKLSKGYNSKGERPNVNKKISNGMRSDSSVSLTSLLQAQERRAMIIAKPQGEAQKKLKIRYELEDKIAPDVARVLNKFGACGLTKAEAVHAAKTNYMEKLIKKWNIRLKEFLKAKKAA